MHRRNRHFNASAAGGVCVLDARYLSGLSNGNGISSWTDRNKNTNNSPTQATANNQPVYTTNVLNGNPGALFNDAASSQGRWLDFPTGITTGATSLSAIYFYKRTSITGTNGAILTNFSTNVGYNVHEPWGGDNNAYLAFGRTGITYQDGIGRVVFNLTTPVPNNQNTITYIQSATNDWRFYANNTLVYSNSSNIFSTSSNAKLGGNGGCADSGCGGAYYFWTGYIYSVAIFKKTLTDSLRKRIYQSIGFSFKFAI